MILKLNKKKFKTVNIDENDTSSKEFKETENKDGIKLNLQNLQKLTKMVKKLKLDPKFEWN